MLLLDSRFMYVNSMDKMKIFNLVQQYYEIGLLIYRFYGSLQESVILIFINFIIIAYLRIFQSMFKIWLVKVSNGS